MGTSTSAHFVTKKAKTHYKRATSSAVGTSTKCLLLVTSTTALMTMLLHADDAATTAGAPMTVVMHAHCDDGTGNACTSVTGTGHSSCTTVGTLVSMALVKLTDRHCSSTQHQ